MFSSSSLDVVCETAARALEDELGMSVEQMASAFVVVTCGYEFVWYELGYRYYLAAASTSPYTLTTGQDNVYSAKCGQIVLFS
ncbi:hypothetical protein AAVH_24233 [Aphelenchoides avenae]|nr:hypothetical protein AAVH_24233 [Aphelenchus avenae]